MRSFVLIFSCFCWSILGVQAQSNTMRSNAQPAKSTNTRQNTAPKNTTAAPRNGANNAAKQPATTNKTIPTAMPAAPSIAPAGQGAPKIQWMSLEEALEKNKTEKRKIYIDVYTQWCGWCKRMDETTFSDPDVVNYMNQHYYAVKFDAEQDKDIQFLEKTYKFRRNGARGYHELASLWLNNRLSFPTSVFLDENLNVIQPIPGYLDGSKLEAVLNYFGTDSHKTTPWETYERRFSN